MKTVVLIGLASLLTGCASVDSLRHGDPKWSGESAKTAAEYAACVSDAWRSMSIRVDYSPVPGGAELLVSDFVSFDYLLRAQDRASGGSSAIFNSRLPYGYSQLLKAAERCI